MSWRNNLNGKPDAVLKYTHDIPHNVIFVVGQEKRKISCHTSFLSIASPVFEAMFSGRHGNSNANQHECEEIIISDMDSKEFENIIMFAYNGKPNVDITNVEATIYAADKYLILELIDLCSEIMKNNLDMENAIEIYQLAMLLNVKILREAAWEYIAKHSGALLNSEKFLKFSEENLLEFLKLDYITTIKSELDVFYAIMRWANHQCDIRGEENKIENVKNILVNLIPLIRFPTMNVDEFRHYVVPTGIFTQEEFSEILQYFESPNDQKRANAMKYSCDKRIGLCVASFCSVAPHDKQYQEVPIGPGRHYDRFAVCGYEESLQLKSVGVVLSQNSIEKAKLEVKITLKQYDESIDDYIHIQDATKCLSTRALEICEIEFDDNVNISPRISYRLEVQPTDTETFVAGFVESLKRSSPVILKTPDKQIRVIYSPVHHVIWSLEFV